MTRKRQVSEEEAELLAHAMKDVRVRTGRAKPRALALPKSNKPSRGHAVMPTKAGATEPVPRPKSTVPAAIDRRTEQKLKRGRIEIDATLDLHGLKQQSAHFKLMHFIARAYEGGDKAVLIITGKGTPRGDGDGLMPGERRGILRSQVPLWLEEAPLRDYVCGVKPAGPRHGGAGALYVLIKRKR